MVPDSRNHVKRYSGNIIKEAALESWSEQKKEEYIIYPYEKALCQGVLLQMPQLESEELSYEELQKMESKRMSGLLGSSGK